MQKIGFCDRYGLTQAVLNGTKTMTRRVEKGLETFEFDYEVHFVHSMEIINQYWDEEKNSLAIITPQGKMKVPTRYKLGEVVAVAQSYETLANSGYLDQMTVPANNPVQLEFKKEYTGKGWSNKMFVKPSLMPHQIQITDINIERLQDISEEDCLKEGIQEYFPYIDRNPTDKVRTFRYFKEGKIRHCISPASKCFAYLIDDISGKGTWQSNPFVVVYEFKLIK